MVKLWERMWVAICSRSQRCIASVTTDKLAVHAQVDSLGEADNKIDDLAATGKLNPALLLTMAKAYAAAKETDMTKEEVKDIMAHLYFKVICTPRNSATIVSTANVRTFGVMDQ
jgi:hypothetical protein